jgi:hypothetical protein
VGVWHSLNDPYREDNTLQGQIPVSAESAANMDALYLLLDESSPDERVMKAELARQLGRFAEALKLLEFGFDDRYRHMGTVNVIKELASQRDTRVAEVKR